MTVAPGGAVVRLGDDVLIGNGALVFAVGDLHVGASKTFLFVSRPR